MRLCRELNAALLDASHLHFGRWDLGNALSL
jgi:hypothetical protein